MGIKSLFGFGQARDKPVDKAADAGYSFLFGRTNSGKPVNETTAMQTTAVYACVRICRKLSHHFRFTSTSTKKVAVKRWFMTTAYTRCSMMSPIQR